MAIGGIDGTLPAGAASDLGALLQQKQQEDIEEIKRRKKLLGDRQGSALSSPAVTALTGGAGY